MKSLPTTLLRFLSFVAVFLSFAAERPLFGQECPLILPGSPSNNLTAYITEYPYDTASGQNSLTMPLISYFMVDVTNIVAKTNYSNPPIPYGLYPAWCVDEWDDINADTVNVPGNTAYTGALYSTCDPNLNSELPPGHTNTLVSSTNWQMVNYILNHQTYDGTNAFYWSVQAAINTLVGSGVGSVGYCGYVLTTPLPDGSLPDGSCGYSTYNPTVVAALLTAASNNYASWVPQCGDVYGAVYVTNPTNEQFIMLEVPVPCSPCIQVTKQVACLQPNGSCGQFGSVAQGFSADCPGAGSGNNPAFCYEITVTNCGTIALTNVVVSDNLLGDLTTNFFANPTNVFEPGASATMYFSMAFPTNATNTVTVQGQAQLAATVTNGASVYTNGMPVADTATAVALVSPASISCGLTLYSPLDLDGNTNDNDVLLPPASYFSQPPSVSFNIEICNTGSSALTGVTLTAPALSALGLILPSGFNLAAGQCTNFPLGSAILTCSNQTFFSVNTSGTVEPDATHCGVYNLSGGPLYVCSSCNGTVECTNGTGCLGVASVSGTVVLDCQAGTTNLSGDTPLSGVPVVLYGAASNSLVTNITDLKGDYSFTNLSAGIYYIAVETATNYAETYPTGVTNGEVSVSLVACQNLTGINFGFADTTPPIISVLPGLVTNLGCNPTNLPSDSNFVADVIAIVSCGSSNITVTHADTNVDCLYTRTYLVTVTDTYGNSASTNFIYTWTSNTVPPVIVGAPVGSDLGCNPTNLPTLASVTNGIIASNACNLATLSATNILTVNGCFATNVFIISALDACGNSASTNVVYTWMVNSNPPSISGAPLGGYLGCNPTNLPTTNSVLNGVSASNACGLASLSAPSVLTSNGCYFTNTFTITAVDGCGNSASIPVIYSWTVNSNPPSISGTPLGGYLGCNPTNLPTTNSVLNGVSASNACGNATLSATCALVTNGCYFTNTFTIKALDGCGNMSSTNVVYSWTKNSTPPVIKGTPLGGYLGCNPTSLPTTNSVLNGVSASNTCGNATLSATCALATNGCYFTNTFTIKASDGCGNTSSTSVVYSWTENSTPPVIKGTPLGCYLGCNPTNRPTTNSVLNGMSASNTCGSAILSAICAPVTNGCYVTNTFTIKAIDGCGNMSSTNVVYSWTVNTSMPVIHGTPAGTNFGCNPATLPTVTSVTNGMSATAACGTANLGVTCALVTNGCFVTNTFTIKATDGCGNTASTNVVYTWMANVTGPIVMCPSNVTVVTNICQMYCTFTPGDWCGSCNGGSRYNNNWWQNYCGNNQVSQCFPSFTNWWNSCGASGNQCSTWWTNWCNSRPTNWWGCWSGSGYQNGNWYNSWNNNNNNNYYNQGSQSFVPCAGNNPNNILNNCFNNVYPNGCVTIGNTNGGNCVRFTSCNAAQTCLNWGGNPGVLNNCSTNPSSCSAGSFCSQVLALKLNCDFGDYGCAPGFVGKCGDLVLCNPSSPCNGLKVRDVLSACNCALGGGACPQGCSIQYLCGLCSNLNQCFEGCQVSGWCSSNLCSVYIPTPAQTGTATVEDTCSPNPTLTYHDTVTQGSCGATYVISREWMAVDSCGNSNTCTQTITVAQTNSCSLSGLVVLACSGDSNLNNNEGITNVTVNLESSQGNVIETTTTDANGNYSFSSLAPANYNVVVVPPSGYTETYPAGSGNKTNVTIAACESLAGVDFAYVGSTLGVQLIKSAPSCMSYGCVIPYTFAVTNTGNTCETLTVVDPLLGGTIFSQTSVAPGQGFVFTSNYTVGSATCMLTNTAWAVGTGSNGKSTTNTSSVVTCITTKCVTNEICGNFNSQNPGNGYVWCNANLSCTPNKACTVYCQNATVTFSCKDGKTYTFPVPDCQVRFTNCSSGSCSYNSGNNCWTTTLPCAGDSQCFLTGCGIPWQSDFANCQSVCWTGTFSCSTPGVNCNWQWGAACYNNSNFSNCGSVTVKPCQQTSCGYNNSDCAGTPENCKSSCQGGACGYGGNNYCGSWSSTGSFTCH